MIDPAKSLSPTQTRDELSTLLDRARQERFRLLDLLKESRQSVVATAVDVRSGQPLVPDQTREDVQHLAAKVQQLNAAVTQRMDKLRATEARVTTRVDQLQRLELKMTNLAERFESLVTEARQMEPVLAASEDRTRDLRTAADRAKHVFDDAERRGETVLQDLRAQVAATMNRADDVARSLRQRFDRSLTDHQEHAAAALSETDDQLLVQAQKLDERLAGLADLFDHQSDQIMDDLKQRANVSLDHIAASAKGIAPATPAPAPTPEAGTDDGPKLRVA